MKLNELAERIGAEVVGDGSLSVSACNTLADASQGELSFLANQKYAKQLETTRATGVVVGLSVSSERVTLL